MQSNSIDVFEGFLGSLNKSQSFKDDLKIKYSRNKPLGKETEEKIEKFA